MRATTRRRGAGAGKQGLEVATELLEAFTELGVQVDAARLPDDLLRTGEVG